MHVTEYTTTDVADLKRKARLLSREANITHRQALDILARTEGYSHWGSCRATLEAATPPPGWKRDGSFSAYPPLIHGILSRDDVACFAINADGSAWTATEDSEWQLAWTRIAPSKVDHRDAIREFMDSIPGVLRSPSGLTFVVSGADSDRLTARRSSRRGGAIEITIRKGIKKDDPRLGTAGNWNMEKPVWHAHLLSARSDGAVQNACDLVVGGNPGTKRLVTFGAKVDPRRYPNRIEAFRTAHKEQYAIDYGMRVSGGAFVAIADTPARAAMALTMASMNHAPIAVLVDAEPEDVRARLTYLAHAGNVSSNRNVREGLAETIALLPERCTLHD